MEHCYHWKQVEVQLAPHSLCHGRVTTVTGMLVIVQAQLRASRVVPWCFLVWESGLLLLGRYHSKLQQNNGWGWAEDKANGRLLYVSMI